MSTKPEIDALDIVAAWVAEARRRTASLSRHEMRMLSTGQDLLSAAGRLPTVAPLSPDLPVSVLARRVVRTEARLRRALRAAHGPGAWSRHDRPRNTYGRYAREEKP